MLWVLLALAEVPLTEDPQKAPAKAVLSEQGLLSSGAQPGLLFSAFVARGLNLLSLF